MSFLLMLYFELIAVLWGASVSLFLINSINHVSCWLVLESSPIAAMNASTIESRPTECELV